MIKRKLIQNFIYSNNWGRMFNYLCFVKIYRFGFKLVATMGILIFSKVIHGSQSAVLLEGSHWCQMWLKDQVLKFFHYIVNNDSTINSLSPNGDLFDNIMKDVAHSSESQWFNFTNLYKNRLLKSFWDFSIPVQA